MEEFAVMKSTSLVPKSPAQLMEQFGAGMTVDQLTTLMDLQLRWRAEEARLAWIEDMARLKADMPTILKTAHKAGGVRNGKEQADYWYAELDKACPLLIAALNKYNFTHRWETLKSEPAWIEVSCVIQHKMGHSERTTLGGPPDATGGKNAIQAVGSTKFYLERYTLFAALGIAPKGQDTDGVAAGISTERRAEQVEWIQNCRNVQELTNVWKAAHEEASSVRDYAAVRLYLEAKDKRKDQLLGGEL